MKTISLALFLLVSCAVAPRAVHAQSAPTNGSRKVTNKVVPEYPHLARDMNLTGAVRLEVVVNANGTVKAIQVKGGSPLLVQFSLLHFCCFPFWFPLPLKGRGFCDTKFCDRKLANLP
jgi:Gram-negative bacterial TonB protein C-terminal